MSRNNFGIFFLGIIVVIIFIISFIYLEAGGDIDFFKNFNIPEFNKKPETNSQIEKENDLLRRIETAFTLNEFSKTKDLIYDYISSYPQGENLKKVYLLASKVYYYEKDYEKTIDFLSKIFNNYNTDLEKEGVKLLTKACVEIDSFNPLGYGLLAMAEKNLKEDFIYLGLGYQNVYARNYNEAIKNFLNVRGEEGFKGLARVYIEMGDYSNAIENYLKYFYIAQKNTTQYENMKNSFLKQALFYADKISKSNPEEALRYYKAIIDNFNNEAESDIALLKSAKINIAKKKYDEAISYLDRALKNNITNSDEEAMFLIAQTYYLINRKDISYEIFTSFLKKYPDSLRKEEVREWLNLIKKEIY